eukprot:450624-Pyramimonas_sp.AAC.1
MCPRASPVGQSTEDLSLAALADHADHAGVIQLQLLDDFDVNLARQWKLRCLDGLREVLELGSFSPAGASRAGEGLYLIGS